MSRRQGKLSGSEPQASRRLDLGQLAKCDTLLVSDNPLAPLLRPLVTAGSANAIDDARKSHARQGVARSHASEGKISCQTWAARNWEIGRNQLLFMETDLTDPS